MIDFRNAPSVPVESKHELTKDAWIRDVEMCQIPTAAVILPEKMVM